VKRGAKGPALLACLALGALLGGEPPPGGIRPRAWAGEPFRILHPGEGSARGGTSGWLVVRAPAPPRVTVDGRPAGDPRSEGDAHHWRLQGLRPEGSRVAVGLGGQEQHLTVRGRSASPVRFHADPPPACAECHTLAPGGCTGCHRWPGGKHEPVLAEGCVRCHDPPEWRPREVPAACAACHPAHAGGKHPRLRHPLTSPRDPLRPGRPMECVSCHDPHGPRCLGCLSRGELREWCKECHGSP
jgi:hypothetical protein